MTDKDMLERAARAAGVKGHWVDNYGSGDYYYRGSVEGIYTECEDGGLYVWNPLTDDGDALRLAVKLKIGMIFSHGRVLVGGGKKYQADEMEEDYKYAIVRAAAAMAK